MSPKYQKAAYGGENWSPRTSHHRDEIGSLWASCGLNSEWSALKQVLLHPPGPELTQIADPESAQLLEIPDWEPARQEHNEIAKAYQDFGVSVHNVEPEIYPEPKPDLLR